MVFRPNQSGVFYCVKCQFDTSGILLGDKETTHRECRDCGSPYVLCNHCGKATSGTRHGEDAIECDHCKKIVSPTAPKY